MSLDYIAGFSKTAEALGVDPCTIVKLAASTEAPKAGGTFGQDIAGSLGGAYESLKKWWGGLDDATKKTLTRTAIGVGTGGLYSMLFGSGSAGSVLGHGLAGGLGAYALHRSGATDMGLKYLKGLADQVTAQTNPAAAAQK